MTKKDDQAPEAENTTDRRRVLQSLVAGGVVSSASMVPAKWSKPVVDSVMLPAHGQSSGLVLIGGAATLIASDAAPEDQTSEGLASRVLNMVVEPAQAAQSSLCTSLLGNCLTFVFTGGANGPVSGSISGVPSGNGTLVGQSLPPGFMIGPFAVSGTFSADFTTGTGLITNCVGVDWQSGRACNNEPVSETTTQAPTTTGTNTTTGTGTGTGTPTPTTGTGTPPPGNTTLPPGA